MRDDAEHLGLDVRPVGIAGFCHGNEVDTVEDGRHALDIEELSGERRWVWGSESGARSEIFQKRAGELLGQDTVVRDKFKGLSRQQMIG